jgi:hypothetical protein
MIQNEYCGTAMGLTPQPMSAEEMKKQEEDMRIRYEQQLLKQKELSICRVFMRIAVENPGLEKEKCIERATDLVNFVEKALDGSELKFERHDVMAIFQA